jgi:large subunit ribosomal protein L31
MKDGIHPEYHEKIKVTCTCGNAFETGSTESEINVEVCSACHPFYTGKQKLIDVAGRVDKFKKKLADSKTGIKSKKKKTKKATKQTEVKIS